MLQLSGEIRDGWTMVPMAESRSTRPLASFSSSNLEAELMKAELSDK